ncbi:Calx-beta domain-containing protein [Argonema galeatum]|uniref:Calx-beta domain-containing protein n=1 Tax=Argonema galeatum TaxID=2942762 RepID=UPI00201326FF|nr:Calx-beta domain-containing protein [Argonema galeatum]MCL1465890.1 hypothetical protein [Argonema galeatum A003/A1]
MALFFGTDTNDTLIGTPEADFISGYAANDILQGIEGDDQLNGNSQNDTIYGGIGNDLAHGGQDNDLIFGDIGNDIIYGDLGNDTGFGGDGDDLLYGDQGIEANFGGNGDDFLFGDAGLDTLFGLDGNDSLNGGQDADVVNGNQGNDNISGGKGNDIVRGGQGNDLVSGDLGDDFIYGDIGIDTLTGGDGLDTFFLRKGIGGATVAEADIITDYVHGADKIGLIEGLTLSILNVFSATGNNAADTIIQDAANGQFLAVLKGVNRSTIDASDFVAPGTLAFGGTSFQVNEDGTPVTAVTVTRSDGSDGAVSVAVIPSNGTATAPADYNNTPVVVNFAAGETNKTVTIPIVDDTLAEYAEKINLSLGNATGGATIGTQNTAFVEIVDNDAVSVPKLTFLNPTPNNEDLFGSSVAAVGNNVLIGAPGDDTGARDAGAAYLFDGTTGALLQTLTPNYSNNFGNSVAAVGNNVLIGASGAAYLFDGTTGALLQTFLNPTPDFYDYFGNSVAAVGNNVLIGAPGEDTGAPSAGAAYLFDGTTGALLQTFLNPTPKSFDYFGNSVAAVGNNVLIGARFDDSSITPYAAGAAYLFDGTTGALLRTFLRPTPQTFASFGYSVAAVGNNILIGASEDNMATIIDAGAAYLFDGATGALLQTFLNPTPSNGDNFGYSVAAGGNNVLIGASGDDTGALIDAGAAYLFDGTTGALLRTFLNPTLSIADNFGSSVAAVGNNVLIGAYGDDTGATNAGAAYLF